MNIPNCETLANIPTVAYIPTIEEKYNSHMIMLEMEDGTIGDYYSEGAIQHVKKFKSMKEWANDCIFSKQSDEEKIKEMMRMYTIDKKLTKIIQNRIDNVKNVYIANL